MLSCGVVERQAILHCSLVTTNGIRAKFPTPMWGSVSFDPVGGVNSFGPAILWDTTRALCLHGGCLSHPTSDRGETF